MTNDQLAPYGLRKDESGRVVNYARGGLIKGPALNGDETLVPFDTGCIIPASAARKYGALLDALNRQREGRDDG